MEQMVYNRIWNNLGNAKIGNFIKSNSLNNGNNMSQKRL